MKQILKQDLPFRWFYNSRGNLVVGGKSDEQNEEILKKFTKPNWIVMHTSNPGSPFAILQNDNPSKEELKEMAIFTACFSKEWKKGTKTIQIDVFERGVIYKDKKMKIGTFGIKKRKEILKIKPKLYLTIQKGKLRAIPFKDEYSFGTISQGKLNKEECANKILDKLKNSLNLPISKEEIMQALPSDKMNFK